MLVSLLSAGALVSLFPSFIAAGPLAQPREAPSSYTLDVKRSSSAIRRRANTGVDTDSYSGGAWMAPVIVGGQTFNLLIDTGSADLWIDGKYDLSKSTTGTNMTSQIFNIGYGDGSSAHGWVVQEHVEIGGAVVPSMQVGVAVAESTGSDNDGLLGIAFKGGNSIRPIQQPTFVEMLQTGSRVFTCNFHNDGTGSISFGKVDGSKYQGELQKVPVNNDTDASWTIDEMSFSAGGKSLGASMSMVFDTGKTTTTLLKDQLYAYYALVNGAKDTKGDGSNWGIPCGTQLPDLTFHFDASGANATIPGNAFYRDHGANQCESIITIEAAFPRGSCGDPFFLSQFVAFNQDEPSMSFAPQSYSGGSGTSTPGSDSLPDTAPKAGPPVGVYSSAAPSVVAPSSVAPPSPPAASSSVPAAPSSVPVVLPSSAPAAASSAPAASPTPVASSYSPVAVPSSAPAASSSVPAVSSISPTSTRRHHHHHHHHTAIPNSPSQPAAYFSAPTAPAAGSQPAASIPIAPPGTTPAAAASSPPAEDDCTTAPAAASSPPAGPPPAASTPAPGPPPASASASAPPVYISGAPPAASSSPTGLPSSGAPTASFVYATFSGAASGVVVVPSGASPFSVYPSAPSTFVPAPTGVVVVSGSAPVASPPAPTGSGYVSAPVPTGSVSVSFPTPSGPVPSAPVLSSSAASSTVPSPPVAASSSVPAAAASASGGV